MRNLDEKPPPLRRIVTGKGPLRVEQREVARLKRHLAAVLDHGGEPLQLQAKQEDAVIVVGDVASGHGGIVQAVAFDLYDVEFA
jgi:hypothetical protein